MHLRVSAKNMELPACRGDFTEARLLSGVYRFVFSAASLDVLFFVRDD